MSRSGSLKIPQSSVCPEGFVWSDNRRGSAGDRTERTSEGRKRAADSAGLQTAAQKQRRSLVHHKVVLFLHDEL